MSVGNHIYFNEVGENVVEDIVFSPLYCLCYFAKDQLTIFK